MGRGSTMASVAIERGFIDIAEGQVHYRAGGEAGGAAVRRRPLVLFHGSPGSTKQMERLIAALGTTRPVIALDTLGMGDSSPPAREDADMVYFADAARRALTAHGVTGKVDLLGHHTGARIATEFAIAWPEWVGKMILDGMSAEITDQAREYAKSLDRRHLVDQVGTQFFVIWNTLRDQYLFRPYTKRLAANVRPNGLPPLDHFHDHVVEILKGIGTSHVAYRAAVLYDSPERLPLIKVPTLATCAREDSPFAALDRVAELVPGCTKLVQPQANAENLATDEEIRGLATVFADWLDR
ncbi:MAG: alpha/beta hydrolase [Alphaproteobacteria bacterium]|nr:alpha/beta hydrolase [Alphaproteobacteria bacterium]